MIIGRAGKPMVRMVPFSDTSFPGPAPGAWIASTRRPGRLEAPGGPLVELEWRASASR